MKIFLPVETIGHNPATSEKRFLISLILLFLLFGSRAQAILVGSSTYQTTAPTVSDIANWDTGWGSGEVSGWGYVGKVNAYYSASGVYLGNGWVITAAHVGAATFTLGVTDYTVVGTPQIIGTADLTLFQISNAPNLPSLTIATTAPVPFSRFNSGSSVAMIGYGGGKGETWGVNTVTTIGQSTFVNNTWTTTDFVTAYGTTTHGSSSITNNAQVVGGDSGGGDFIYDSSTSKWTLAGLNEANNAGDSYMEQLSSYASEINAIIAVPEPSISALAAFSLVAMIMLRLTLRRAIPTENR